MTAREEVLARIASAHRAAPPPDLEYAAVARGYRTSSDLGAEALVDVLVDRLEDYKALVRRCADAELPATRATASPRATAASRGKMRWVRTVMGNRSPESWGRGQSPIAARSRRLTGAPAPVWALRHRAVRWTRWALRTITGSAAATMASTPPNRISQPVRSSAPMSCNNWVEAAAIRMPAMNIRPPVTPIKARLRMFAAPAMRSSPATTSPMPTAALCENPATLTVGSLSVESDPCSGNGKHTEPAEDNPHDPTQNLTRTDRERRCARRLDHHA